MTRRRSPHLVLALLAGLGVVTLVGGPAAAQDNDPALENGQIVIDQKVVIDAQDRLRKLRIVDRLRQFLAPLRLPRSLLITTRECGQLNLFYDSLASAIVICDEYMTWLDQIAPPAGQEIEGVTRDDVYIGGLAGPLLHEAGHAVFDIFEAPVLGREEDAADQIAAFILLQFGPELSLPAIKGFAYTLRKINEDPKEFAQFTDEHGTSTQRYYNTMCIAFGADPGTFQGLMGAIAMPPERASSCPAEYAQVANAFKATILPYVDQALMDKVRAGKWLPFDPG